MLAYDEFQATGVEVQLNNAVYIKKTVLTGGRYGSGWSKDVSILAYSI